MGEVCLLIAMISLYRPMQQTDSSRLDLTHARVNELTMAQYDDGR